MYSLVTAIDLTYELPNGHVLFSNLNFSIPKGIVALIGPNGIGKSTLIKLLIGELQPSNGVIQRKVTLNLLPQIIKPEEVSVQDYLALNYEWSLMGENLLRGISPQTLCSELSGGQWMRVRLATSLKHQFLILDEPTNNLDRQGRKYLLDFLNSFQGSALIVSHDRECLSICSEILELSNKGLSKFGGNWQSYESNKESERKNLKKNLEEAKKNRENTLNERTVQIERQEKRNRRGAENASRGGMPKILLGARKRKSQESTGKINTETLNKTNQAVHNAYQAFKELKLEPIMYLDLIGKTIPSQKLVAEAKNFNVFFDRWIFEKDITFSWRGNIRMAIKGANGSGKSTLLRALLGTDFKTRGELRLGNLTTIYLDQTTSCLEEDLTVLENVQSVSQLIETELRSGLAKFLFEGNSVFKKVNCLSGGERLRAALAKGLLQNEKPELLILDEPTNNLDLANIQFLEKIINKFEGALIIVSHDDFFIKNCNIENELTV